ncbi:MAG TPA: DNA-directed RNA polymerase subunit L [Candidatus Nanoarchaeia archaeon]|nr:DNA-directed RNA polymerase subunit L [Candidatus Nanoarchaeia archaeon]
MEAILIEESPKKLIVELQGESHTILNVLKHKLWENEKIKIATYQINHPLIGIPRLIVETDGSIKPRKAVFEAAEKLKKDVDKFKASFEKA